VTDVADAVAALPAPRVEGARVRLVSLDVFRGLTVAGMLLVNNPGSWSAIYAPLEHADWHGWTPTDLVFPFFLFIVGITTHLSRKDPKGAIRRGALIFLCGLLLNAFPFYWWGKIAGNPDPTLLQRIVYRFAHLRFMGVLQRIGIVYTIAALIAMKTTTRQKIVIIAAILVGYWAVMMCGPLEPPDGTVAARVDRAILGANHIWSISKTWDPEGPLSTIPAVATALLGVLAGEWIARKDRALIERIAALFGAGVLGMLGGSLWGWLFPINKNLWTSSYVIFTAGFACVVLATCMWLIDFLPLTRPVDELRATLSPGGGVKSWTKPFVIYGTNPLIAFVGSGVMARLTDSLIKVEFHGQRMSLHQASYELLFQPFFPEKFASLLWALCFVAFWLGVLAILHKRGIVVRL
jgi:predicted acyltransferase